LRPHEANRIIATLCRIKQWLAGTTMLKSPHISLSTLALHVEPWQEAFLENQK
jgi:hypothetical protein